MNETVTGLAYVNGTRIYYEIAGSGHPVVLNHGGSLDTRMWDDQFELFACRYRVLRYDLRGYGRSAVPDGPYSRAGDLAAIMDHVDIDHAYQVGMSMGGGIVIELTLTHPGRADALVLVGSGLGRGGRWSREWRDLSETRDCITREEGVDAGNEYWLGSHIFAPALERPEVDRRVREIVIAYSGWLWLNEDHTSRPSRRLPNAWSRCTRQTWRTRTASTRRSWNSWPSSTGASVYSRPLSRHHPAILRRLGPIAC